MTSYSDQPWAHIWENEWGDVSGFHDPSAAASVLALFDRLVREDADRAVLSYFSRTWSAREIDAESDALAVALQASGVRAGDRVALYLQNVPEFFIGTVATWKLGGIVVPVNPMYRDRELAHIAEDAQVSAIIVLEELVSVIDAVYAGGERPLVISTNGLRSLAGHDVDVEPLRGIDSDASGGDFGYGELVARYAGARPDRHDPASGDVAYLAYTSGTTGPPKGALLGHGAVLFSCQSFASMQRLGPDEVIFAVAPLFHVTGLVCSVALTLALGCRLVLGYRFDVETALALIDEHRATFTVGATTVFIALLSHPRFSDYDISSLQKIVCGGAPIPPSVVARYEGATGVYLHNGYGMTETTSPTFGIPRGARSPVNPVSGSLALGVPLPDTKCRLIDDDGRDVPIGEPGEVVVRGPHVMLGYWNDRDATSAAFVDGWLRTGDVASMDEAGWFYLVDRKKDQINASGFKVWPQEVEEVLYEHAAVREAGVVGVPDEYRGETVKAFVSLHPGARVDADELVAFCRARLAAYKVPRRVEFLDDLPKTVTGKITRRSLRDYEAATR